MPLRKKIMWTLLSAGIILICIVGYYAYSFWSFADKISTEPKDSRFKYVHTQNTSAGGEDLTPPKWEGKERVNILLLGGDSRGLQANEIPRSDSIMIASLDPVSKKSYLFSILRDTYVKIPNSGMDRINTAISTGGPELAMKTVSDLMGIPIQYYVYTDFKGFIALVDALGGIDMDVEKDMKYQDAADNHEYDIDLKKGFQHLNGKTALEYVRFRHDASSDFTRTERQRKFLKAVGEKLQSTSSLIKLPRIMQSVDPYIETNLSVTQMLKLASLGYEVKTDGMVSQQVPPMDLLEEKQVGGAKVLGVNPAKLQTFVKKLLGETVNDVKSGVLSMGADDERAAQAKSQSSSAKSTLKSASGISSARSSPAPAVRTEAPAKTVVKPSPAPATSKAPETAPVPKASAGTEDGAAGDNSGSAGGKKAGGTAAPKPDPSTAAAGAGTAAGAAAPAAPAGSGAGSKEGN